MDAKTKRAFRLMRLSNAQQNLVRPLRPCVPLGISSVGSPVVWFLPSGLKNLRLTHWPNAFFVEATWKAAVVLGA